LLYKSTDGGGPAETRWVHGRAARDSTAAVIVDEDAAEGTTRQGENYRELMSADQILQVQPRLGINELKS